MNIPPYSNYERNYNSKYFRFNRQTQVNESLPSDNKCSILGWLPYDDNSLSEIPIDELIPFYLGKQNQIYVYSREFEAPVVGLIASDIRLLCNITYLEEIYDEYKT